MSAEDRNPDAATLERWTYMGRRFVRGKLLDAWWDGTTSLLFAKTPGRILGGFHDLKVERDDAGGITVYGGAEYDAGHPLDDRIGEWSALDRAARAEQERERAISRLKRNGPGIQDLTLRELRDLRRKAVAGQDAGLTAAVIQYLYS